MKPNWAYGRWYLRLLIAVPEQREDCLKRRNHNNHCVSLWSPQTTNEPRLFVEFCSAAKRNPVHTGGINFD
jgi:hypothetical protein